MATALLDGIKSITEISKLSQADRKEKAKERSKAGDMAIKKATLLGSMPTEGGTMGEGLMAGANRMAQNPHQNAWTGLIEGLMRGFGMGLKGKEAAEKRKQVEDALDMIDYAMQGQEYLQGIQGQVAQKREDFAFIPSEKQYMDAVKEGTLKPTIQTMLQENGIDPNNVTLSDDKMTLFVDKDGKIEKIPVASMFNPEDSRKFGFTNSMVKTNLEQSANEQVRGLAQENNAMKSKLEIYQDMFSKIQGVDPALAQMVAEGVVEGEQIEKQKLGNETMTAEARKRSSLASQDRANLDKTYRPKELLLREREAETAEQNADSKTVKLIQELVGEEIDAKEDFLRTSPRIIEIVDKYPQIWGSLAQLQWENEDPSYFEAKRRNLMNSGEKGQAAAEMIKYINKMQIDVARGFIRPNQFLEKKGSKAVPNFNMPAASFRKIMGEQIMDANEDIQKLNKRIQAISGRRQDQFYDAFSGKKEYIPPAAPKSLGMRDTTPLQGADSGKGSGVTIVLYDPETKQEEVKSVSDLNQAIAQAKKVGLEVRIK